MATYNGEKYLSEQLRSLAEQTELPDELVICDDESNDSTARVVGLFAATAPFPVRFIRNEQRLGYYENFMKAAGLCTSEYIAFCDQDVWLSEKLAVAHRYIRDTGCTLLRRLISRSTRIHRILRVKYKTVWFLCERIRGLCARATFRLRAARAR